MIALDPREGEGGASRSPRRGGGAHARKLHASLLVLLALGLTVVLGGCGIEEYLYFYPPTLTSLVTEIVPIAFSHYKSNDSVNFYGYELYYLLIDANNEAFISDCNSKIDSSGKAASALIPVLKERGFKPLIGLDASGNALGSVPLFRISQEGVDSGDIDFQIQIDEFGTVKVTGDGAPYVTAPAFIRRNSKTTNGKYRTFSNFIEDDVDNDGDTAYVDEPKPAKVIFRAYVFAYGITDSFSEIFSLPARIGDDDEPAWTTNESNFIDPT